jgi:hypothetical protein
MWTVNRPDCEMLDLQAGLPMRERSHAWRFREERKWTSAQILGLLGAANVRRHRSHGLKSRTPTPLQSTWISPT